MGKIIKLIAQRLALGLVTLFIISLIIAFAVEMLPGDLAEEILGQSATPETVRTFRAELGLNLPPHERYFRWLGGILTGDMGESLATRRPIAELIAPRLSNTLFLAGFAAIIAIPISVGLGVMAALKRNTAFDRIANLSTLSSISFPEFFVAYILIFVFAQQFGWFPGISNISGDISLGDKLYRTMLPAFTLTLVVIAHMMRMTRAAIINLLASPYIEMARLKGIPPRRIIIKHALPNALAPIINVIALNMAYLIVGVVVVEVVFVYPGLGQLLVDSVSKRDLPVVQAGAMIFAAVYIFLNLSADVLSIMTNPRLMHPR